MKQLITLSCLLLLINISSKAQMKLQATTSSSIASIIPGYSQVSTINSKSITYSPQTDPTEPSPIDGDTTTEKNGAYHYGDPVSINVSISDGNYTNTTAGIVWTVKIIAYNALNIGIKFNHFNLSPNAKMYVYNNDKTELVGDIMAQDFADTTSVSIPTLTGNSATIYIIEPNSETFQSSIAITQIIAGFRAFSNLYATNGIPSQQNDIAVLDNKYMPHGPAFINNNVDASNLWSTDCIPSIQCGITSQLLMGRAVALFSSNGYRCTGTLLNNEQNNGRPYFLTAFHCLDVNWNGDLWKKGNGQLDADEIAALRGASIIFQYWQNSCNSSIINSGIEFSGATLRAAYKNSDMVLLELNNPPGIGDGVNYAGWSRQTNLPSDELSFIIHHPEGNDMRLTKTSSVHNYWLNTDYWQAYYSSGVVTKGSSGSGLFNGYGQVIGQLKAGWSSCSSSSFSDRYGKLNVSWGGGGSNNSRLSNWLSPIQNLGSTESLIITPLEIRRTGDISCSTTTTFSVPNLIGCTYIWNVSSNLQIISGQGTATLTVQGITGSTASNATINVTINDSKGTIGSGRTANASLQVKVELPVTGEVDLSGLYLVNLQDYNWVYGVTKVRLTSPNVSNTQWYFWSGDWPTYFQNNANGELEFAIEGDQTASFVAISQNSCGNSQSNVYTFRKDGIYSYKTTPKTDTIHALNEKDIVSDSKFNQLVTKIFPNPTRNILNIVLAQKNKSTKSLIREIIVYDKLGRAVLNQKLLKQAVEATINIQSLRTDAYFIKIISNDNQSETLKFIKE